MHLSLTGRRTDLYSVYTGWSYVMDLATRTKKLRTYPGSLKARATRRLRYRVLKETAPDGRTENSFIQKFRRRGLTIDQYHALAEKQDFLCAVCGEEPQPQSKKQGNVDNFVTDHDHQTGRVRGLLCWPCNAALGHLRDNPEMGRKAIAYLEKHHAFRIATPQAFPAEPSVVA